MRGHTSNVKHQKSFRSSSRLARLEGPVILRVLRHGPTRRALVVGCGLQMFQQLSGINTVMYVIHVPLLQGLGASPSP